MRQSVNLKLLYKGDNSALFFNFVMMMQTLKLAVPIASKIFLEMPAIEHPVCSLGSEHVFCMFSLGLKLNLLAVDSVNKRHKYGLYRTVTDFLCFQKSAFKPGIIGLNNII
jgi:hypothetical protein